MKAKRRDIFWIAVILVIPLLELFIGVDLADVGFSMNQYKFWLSDIGSIYLPLYLSDAIGWGLLEICSALSIPGYLGIELAWAFSCYYLCFLSLSLYKRYRNDTLILPVLAFAVLLAKTNFSFFIYNTSVALMALTGLYFLIRGMNDRRPRYLAVSSFFFVLASLCKISSLLQFAVFAVLFYELYRTRDRAYFFKQLLHVVAGFVAGLGLAALLLHVTCGIGNYVQMVIDMFFYAGNSTDGHTIGNMVMINLKGVLRGMLFAGGLAALWFLLKKCGKHWRAACGIVLAGVVLFIVGKALGFDRIPGLSILYGEIFSFYNALAVLNALTYISLIGIMRDKSCSKEYQMLVLASAILMALMPIGSNVGITHICNEFFFALPYIWIWLKDAVEKEAVPGDGKKMVGPAAFIVLLAGVWIVSLSAYQSFNRTRAYGDKLADMKSYQLEELRFMKADRYSVEQLEELVEFVESVREEDETMLAVGGIPLVNYLTDMAPAIDGCGGWMETDYVTAEEIAEQLRSAEKKPMVVVRSAGLEINREKSAAVLDFVAENSYTEAFENEEYKVYLPNVKEN